MASRASGTAAEDATLMEWTCTRSFSRGRNMVGKTMGYGGVLVCVDRAGRWRSGCSNGPGGRCTPADVNFVLLLLVQDSNQYQYNCDGAFRQT